MEICHVFKINLPYCSVRLHVTVFLRVIHLTKVSFERVAAAIVLNIFLQKYFLNIFDNNIVVLKLKFTQLRYWVIFVLDEFTS